MKTVNVATLKRDAEKLVAKAIAGEPTLVEQDGKCAVLMPCESDRPDFDLYPETDRVLQGRLNAPGAPPTESDWARDLEKTLEDENRLS